MCKIAEIIQWIQGKVVLKIVFNSDYYLFFLVDHI